MSERETQPPNNEVDIGEEARRFFQQPQNPPASPPQSYSYEARVNRALEKLGGMKGAEISEQDREAFWAGERVTVNTSDGKKLDIWMNEPRDGKGSFNYQMQGPRESRHTWDFALDRTPIDPTPPSSSDALEEQRKNWTAANPGTRMPGQLDNSDHSYIQAHYKNSPNMGDALFEFQNADGSSQHVFVMRNEAGGLTVKPVSGPEGYQDRVSAHIRVSPPEIVQDLQARPAPVDDATLAATRAVKDDTQPTIDEREAIIDFANAHARQHGLTRDNMPPVLFHNQDNGKYWFAQVEGGEFKISQHQKGDTIPAGTVQVQMNVPERTAQPAPAADQAAPAKPQSEYPVDQPTQLEEQMIQTTMGIESNQKKGSMLFRSGDHHFLATRTADHELDIQPVADPKALGMEPVLLHDSDFKSWMDSYEKQGNTAIVEEHRQRRGMTAAAPPNPEVAQTEQAAPKKSQEQPTEAGPQFFAVPDQQPVKMQPLPDDQKADSGTPVPAGQTSPARKAIEGSGSGAEPYHIKLQAAQHALAAVDPKYAKMMTYTAANGEERMADGLEGQRTRAAFEAFAQERGFDPRTASIDDFIKHAQDAKLEQENNLVDANRPDAWKDNIVKGYSAAATEQEPLSHGTFNNAAKGPETQPEPGQGPKVQEQIANINMTQALHGA